MFKSILSASKATARFSSGSQFYRRSLATLTPDPIMIKPKPTNPTMSGPTPFAPYTSEPPTLPATLHLATGDKFKGTSFGAPLNGKSISGEVVFTTSLVGYPESMSDPSYRGQILVFTQPLIGNYGVPSSDTKDSFGLLQHFESSGIQCSGIVVNDYALKYSHWEAVESLGQWCARYGIPAISGVDTRAVVSLLRDRGSTLGEIAVGEMSAASSSASLEDPNARNLCAEVSVKGKTVFNHAGDVHVALIGAFPLLNYFS
jgi:carbamoyl-phosphate synthase small subunit